jgi:D-arabinose 1-dehydrogenase-like Zn-dependent alcohol dehydrogenase
VGKEILNLYLSGKIDCMIGKVIEFEEIKDYLIDIKKGKVNGKIVAKLY